MKDFFTHLGEYSDIVSEARRQGPVHPLAHPGPETQRKVREVLGWCDLPEEAAEVCVQQTWERNGLAGELLSWSTGYGPATQAWLIKPAGSRQPLPAVLALHDHGGFKFCGKEKIAEGPDEPEPFLVNYWAQYYGNRPWVNALAQEGFAVLVHDTFLWGSRRFPLEKMQEVLEIDVPDTVIKEAGIKNVPPEIASYNYLAGHHEHMVAKYCNLLGTSMAGVVAHEDRIALNYLRSRPDVQSENVSCMGLSGGGNRAGLLRATAQELKAAVVVGLMSTYAGLLDHIIHHTWMFYPYLWSRYGDWPDLVACQAPARLLVQYDLEDELFTEEGMRAAHERLVAHYRTAGNEKAYCGQFFPGLHKFDLEMQEAAFEWLKNLPSA